MTLTPTDFHLALEAVVAYVDGELSSGAETRARAHVGSCAQCSFDVAAQREAKAALVAAGGPDLPGSLLGRLQRIPFTTDLDTPGMTLAMHGERLHWSRSETAFPGASPLPGASPSPGVAPSSVVAPPPGGAPFDRRPPGRAEATTRPATRRARLSLTRIRRLRRGLLGAVAGLTVGVLAATVAPAAVTVGSATSQPRPARTATTPGAVSALFGTMDDQIAPRRFAGAVTGLR